MFSRIFSLLVDAVSPVTLAEHLHANGFPVEPHFRGDDLGWTSGELRLPGDGTSVTLERYLTAEDDLRDDLNTYAAELETHDDNPHTAKLMEHVIQTKQLVTASLTDDPQQNALNLAVCRFLAAASQGVYQIDDEGWFAAEGERLVEVS